MSTKEEIRAFIVEDFLLGQDTDDFTDSVSLLDMGIIDSTGILELVEFLESKYNFKVQDNELVPENLDSLDNLVKFVASKAS